MRYMRQSGDSMSRAGVGLGVAERVEEVEEAPLRQVVRGELPDGRAAQEAEVGGHAQEADGDPLQGGLSLQACSVTPPRVAERSRR